MIRFYRPQRHVNVGNNVVCQRLGLGRVEGSEVPGERRGLNPRASLYMRPALHTYAYDAARLQKPRFLTYTEGC